jgi:hypothetical protein
MGFNKDTLSVCADLLSIVGAFASAYAVWRLRVIQALFLAKARLPELQAEIILIAGEINSGLSSFDTGRGAVETSLKKCRAALDGVSGKSDGNLKRRTVHIRDKINKSLPLTSDSRAAVHQIYSDLIELDQLLKNAIRDGRLAVNV